MLDCGLFGRFPCDAIYALHNWPALPAGVIGVNPGPMMAAADQFEVHIQGRGGHGAHAYQTNDPIVIAAQLITARSEEHTSELQSLMRISYAVFCLKKKT